MADDTTEHCMNCGALLHGKFCSACGQKDFGTRVDLKELVGEFASETFEIEGRLPRTLASVVFAPGHYLHEVLAGRRRSFSSPLRFYLLAVFLSVVVIGWRLESATRAAAANGDILIEFDERNGELNVSNGMKVEEHRQAQLGREANRLIDLLHVEECAPIDPRIPWWPTCEPYQFDWLSTLERDSTLECIAEAQGFARVELGLRRLMASRPGTDVLVTLYGLALEQAPLAMSVTIGVFALLLKVFFWRHPATVHVLTSVTFHALVLYGIMAWMLWPAGWVFWAVHGWLQSHALFSLKLAYGESWWRTFPSYLALGLCWLALALAAVLLAVCVGLYRVAGVL